MMLKHGLIIPDFFVIADANKDQISFVMCKSVGVLLSVYLCDGCVSILIILQPVPKEIKISFLSVPVIR